MQIDIISDIVCPWCLIGKRRLEKALAARPDLDVVTRWRPYQLHGELPPEGMARADMLVKKFGSAENAAKIYQRIAQAGTEDGLVFHFDRITRAPNTLEGHLLIKWAGSAGCQDQVVEDLFDAYFVKGEDVSDRTVLLSVARANGMDGDLVEQLLDEGRDRDTVSQEISAIRQMGVTGVPVFVFDRQHALNGAQPVDTILSVIDKLQTESAH